MTPRESVTGEYKERDTGKIEKVTVKVKEAGGH